MKKEGASHTRKLISLYPLKFNEVIADVLKVKPEPKKPKKKATAKRTSAVRSNR